MRNLDVYLQEQRQHEPRQLHWYGHVQPVWSRSDVAIKSTALLTALEGAWVHAQAPFFAYIDLRETPNALDALCPKALTCGVMNQSEKRGSLNRVSSKNRIPFGFTGTSAVLAVAIMGWCGAIHGAEIHEAAELGDLEKVRAYLEQDPKQINATDSKGRTVLGRAARSGKKELVEFLLEKGATEDIFAAAIVGHTDKVAALLKQDPKLINARDSDGKTALHWAALYGQTKVMELLLANKADVNSLDEDGFTPLHWAATFNQSDAVKLLLANKANMNLKVQKYGWTPLRLAVIHGHMATAEALLNGGADPNLKDEENIPLLNQAVIRGKKEMVGLLLDKKADVNKKDSEGETALDEAEEQGNKEIIEFLRQHGAKGK